MTDDWRDRAACVGLTDMFFPVPVNPGRGGHVKGLDPYAKARTVCADCPVIDECLQWAFENHVSDGMWGGLTPRQRRGTTIRDAKRQKHCECCGNLFVYRSTLRRYCSDACRQRASLDRDPNRRQEQTAAQRERRLNDPALRAREAIGRAKWRERNQVAS